MGGAGFKMVGPFQQQDCHERNDQRGAQQIEGVAEGQNKGLLLHDVADRDHRALRRVSAVDDAVADEILGERFDPRTGRLFQ